MLDTDSLLTWYDCLQALPMQVRTEGKDKIALRLEQEFELERLRDAVEKLSCESAKACLMDTLKVIMIQKNAIDELARLVSETAAIVANDQHTG